MLYPFQGKKDGRNPQVGLFLDAVYGTTFLGGDSHCACGTIFKLSPRGALTVLHAFSRAGWRKSNRDIGRR